MPNEENRDQLVNQSTESHASDGGGGGGDDDGNIDFDPTYPTLRQGVKTAAFTSTALFVVHVILVIVVVCLQLVNGVLAAVHLILAIYFFSLLKKVGGGSAGVRSTRPPG